MTAPGWYPDPTNPQVPRWWDGEHWGPPTHQGGGLYAIRFAISAVTIPYTRDSFNAVLSSPRRGSAVPRPPGWVTALSWTSNLMTLVALVVGVLFVIWLQHAAELSRRMGLPARHTPGWAWGGFILPIVNFWFPYQVTRDCLPPDHPGRRDVNRWWALWLVMSFMGLAVVVGAWISSGAGLVVAAIAVVIAWFAGRAAQQAITTVTEAQRELVAPHLRPRPAVEDV